MKTYLLSLNRYFKLFILLPGIMFYSNFSISQIVIGNGTNVINDAPTYGYYDYSWSAQIYLKSELAGSAIINALEFQVSNSINNYQMNNQSIFIKEIPDSMFYSTNYIDPNSIGAVKVFDGSYTWNSSWNTIYLQTPFQYSGTGHLLILWENRDGVWDNTYPTFYGHGAYMQVKTNSQDGGFPYYNGYTGNYRPNIKIHASAPYAIDLAMLEWTSPVNGTSPNANMPISVKFKNSGTDSVSGFNLIYSVDEGATIVTETYSGTVYPGDTVNYTFTNAANMSTIGFYNCGAVVSHPNDSFGYNDTVFQQLTICNVMSGSYTINNVGGGNFNSINDAAASLMNCGVNGPVVFNITNGTYYENIQIGYIPGASLTNNITFQSLSGDSSTVIIQGNQGAPWNLFSSFIKLKRLTFKCSQYDENPIIQILDGCDNIEIRNCNILGADVYHGSENASVIHIVMGTHNNINIINNVIKNGSYGIYIMGNQALIHDSGNVFSNNQLLDQYFCGIHSGVQDAEIISNNTISTSLSNSNYYGIESYNGINNTRITSNDIKVLNTGCNVAIMLNGHNTGGTYSGSAIISNNCVSINTNGSGNCFGIYDYFSSNSSYYFNTINIYGNNIYGNAFYKNGNTNSSIKNNIFCNQAGGYSIYSSASASYLTMNFNNLYTTGSYLGYLSSDYNNLSAWKTGTGLSTNGVSTNPAFLSNTNLHPTSISMNNKATPIAGITIDKDNITRHATTPDIGAYEYTPVANDLAVTEWVGSTNSCGLTSTEQVKINIVNIGTSSQSNFPISFNIDQGTYITETYTGTIVSGDTATYTFTNTVNLSAPGLHKLKVLTALSGDQNPGNDTLKFNLKKVGIIVPPFFEDFEDTTNFYFARIKGNETSLNLTTEYNGNSWVALRMRGGSNNGWNYPTNVTDAFTNNPDHTIKVLTCDINTTGMTVLRLMFDYQNRSTFDIKNNWFRVMINGTSYAKEAFSGDSVWQPQYTDDQSDIKNLEFDLSSYIGGNISISLEAVLRYDDQGSGNGWADQVFIDNFRLWEPALHDVGILNIISVNEQCGDEMDSIYAIIRNFGLSSETNIPVYCSVQADDGFHAYNATYTNTIPSFGLDYLYLGTFNTTQNGFYDVHAYSSLSTDTVNKFNDTIRWYGENEHHKNIPFIETFDSNDYNWDFNGFYVQQGGFFGLTSNALFADVYQQYVSTPPPTSGPPVPNAPYEAKMRRIIGKVTSESYLVFDYAVMGNLSSNDSIIISLSSDCDDTYYKVYKISSSNYWNGQGLNQTAIPIPDYAGEFVSIQISLFNDYNSNFMFAIDNIGIIDAVNITLGNDTTICQGELVTLDAGYNTYPAYSHHWKKNGIFLSDTTSTITVGTSGTYISFVTDSLNFTGSDTINVVVNPKPNVNIISGLNATYCRDEMPVNLIAYPSGGTFTGDGLTGNYFYPSTAYVGNNQVVYTYIDVNGCSDADTIQTVVNALPNVNITTVLSSAYCEDASVVSLSATPGGGIFSGQGVSGNNFNPSMASGVVDIIYTFTNASLCTSKDTISTTVNANPIVFFTSTISPNYCSNSPVVNLMAYPAGGTFSGNGVSGSTFNPSNALTGSNQLIYNYTNVSGCSNSDTITTNVNLKPTATISTSLVSTYCEDASAVILTATPSGGVFNGPGVSGNTFNPSAASYGSVQIVYTYTDGNNCTDKDTISTIVSQLPFVAFTSSLSPNYCSNSAVVNLVAYPSGGTFSGNGVSGSTFNPSNALIGNNQIIYSYIDAFGCTNADTIQTTVNALPNVNITTVLSSAYCDNASVVSLTATPSGGIFSGSGVSVSTFDPSTAYGPVDIFYSFTDLNGCSNTDTVSTVVNPNPFVIFTSALASNYCVNSPSVSLSAYPSGGTYSTAGSLPIFNPATALIGGNEIIYTFTDINGCSSADTISTNVSSLPTVTLSSLSDICENQTQLILSGGIPANGEYSGTGVAPLSGIFYPSVPGPGLIPITYSYTDLNGCTNTDTKNIRVVSIPISNFSIPSNVCPNDTATITYQGSAGASANFSWDFDYGVISSGSGSGPYQVSWDTSGIKQLSLILTDSGCVSATTYNYTNVLSKTSNITAIGSTTVCYGDSVILFANSGFGYSYQWLLNSVAIPNDTNSFLATKIAGNYSAIVTNNYSCSDTSNIISITVNPLPIASFIIISNACTSDTVTVTYTGNATIAANYIWDFDSAIVISGSGQGPYQIIWNMAGTKIVSLIVSENNCVSSLYTSNIVINTTDAIITAIGNTSFCNGDSVALYANTGANLTHQWFKNNILISGALNPYYIASSSGSYHVVVTNIITGCFESSSPVVVTVNTINFNLAFTATPTSFTALPFIVTFNNQTSNTSNYYFYWDFGDGTSSTFVQPFHSYQYDGTYTVTLIAENIQTGCRDTLVKPNYITCTGGSPNPCNVVAQITPSGSAIICVNDSLLLTATSNSGWSYKWLYNGVIITNATTSSIYAKLAGEYRVIVNDTVCTVTSNPFILGNYPGATPVINSLDSIRPCTNDSMELFVSTFYNSYLWSTNETTQSIYVKYSGNYTVTTTTINGCSLVSSPFIVNASLLQPPEICIVGVDSFNHNRIIWERSSSSLIDSFFVYRESTVAGVYTKIGQLDYNQPSMFVDMNSNPAIRAYRYKLTASDTCGAETAMSDFHKTMHLTINKGIAGAYNLIWDGYKGFPFGSYAIYRGVDSTNLSLLTQIQSTLWTYTDLNPPSDTVFYQIEVIKSAGCYPDSIFSKVNTNFNSSRSNVANTMAIVPPDTTGVYQVYANNLNINIYPNPNNGKFTIETISQSRENINIQVFNTIGKLVYSENNVEVIGRMNKEINLNDMPRGIYFVRLINENVNIVRRIVIH